MESEGGDGTEIGLAEVESCGEDEAVVVRKELKSEIRDVVFLLGESHRDFYFMALKKDRSKAKEKKVLPSPAPSKKLTTKGLTLGGGPYGRRRLGC